LAASAAKATEVFRRSLSELGSSEGRPAPAASNDLRKTSVAFAADAAKRSYPETAPRGAEAQAQASVDHGLANRVEVINLSDENWSNVELWVNGKYVVFIPNWPSRRMEQVNFQMLYDRDGGSFPVDNKNIRVDRIEIFKGWEAARGAGEIGGLALPVEIPHGTDRARGRLPPRAFCLCAGVDLASKPGEAAARLRACEVSGHPSTVGIAGATFFPSCNRVRVVSRLPGHVAPQFCRS